ncbi:hypothetical protein LX36DRAFT_42514 [Colletotrichum falcatum]|nr:hypothetical protein LX36DRAFT_42514 [Colletotrichum falcatum]
MQVLLRIPRGDISVAQSLAAWAAGCSCGLRENKVVVLRGRGTAARATWRGQGDLLGPLGGPEVGINCLGPGLTVRFPAVARRRIPQNTSP